MIMRMGYTSGGQFYSCADATKLEAVYEGLATKFATVQEKQAVTAAFAGGGLVLLLGGLALSMLRGAPALMARRCAPSPPSGSRWSAMRTQLPGVAGIGAKGATGLLETYGSVEAALGKLDAIEGRIGKALKAAERRGAAQSSRARTARRHATAAGAARRGCVRGARSSAELNAEFERLGFSELLVSDGGATRGGGRRDAAAA